jgi:predicted Zn finger-like uncharacterized protein
VFVSCDNCFAEYELDDAKIPAGGARLRCTGCDHSFVIAPPETSDQQSADDLAHDALSAEGRGEASPDPERESAPEEDFAPDAEGEREAAPEEDVALDAESEQEAAPEEDFDPDSESDWEFNEVEVPEPEVEEEAPEPDFDRGGEWSDLSSAEDVVDDLLEPAAVTNVDADAVAAVDDLLGEVDTADLELGESGGDLGSDFELDEPGGDLRSDLEPGESGGDLTSGSEFPSESLDLGDAGAIDGSAGDRASIGDDSFDDPSDWDLFDQPAETDAAPVSAGAKGLPASAAHDRARTEPRVELAVAVADDSPTSVRWTDRILEVVGWGAVISMMIAALFWGLAPTSSDARAPAGSWSGAGFEADQIVGRWVDNAVAGSIYVVSGRIRSTPGSDQTSQKGLGIRLFDTTGREINRAPIPLAPEIPERILRESSLTELDAFQARRAGRVAAVGTSWLSFEAVVTDLPRSAGRFELQALDR